MQCKTHSLYVFILQKILSRNREKIGDFHQTWPSFLFHVFKIQQQALGQTTGKQREKFMFFTASLET